MDIFAQDAKQQQISSKLFGLNPNVQILQKQKEQMYNNQKMFQQIKNSQDAISSLDTGIVQALQVKSKLTSLDKQFMDQMFPINQQTASVLVTAQKLTLQTIQKLSAYEIFSVALISLLTGLLQIQTTIDTKTERLIKDPKTGKTYIQLVNQFFQLKLFEIQKLVQKLIYIVQFRKNGQAFIKRMIIQRFCLHMKSVMKYFNYNITKSVFVGLLFNPKSSKVIQKKDIVPVQSAIVAMQMKKLYAQNIYPQGTFHLMNFMKSMANRKRQQFMKQTQIKHESHFNLVQKIPLLSENTSKILSMSQYLFQPNSQSANVMRYALNNFNVDYKDLQPGYSNFKWVSDNLNNTS